MIHTQLKLNHKKKQSQIDQISYPSCDKKELYNGFD